MQEVALDELGMVRGATLVHTGWSALVESLDLSALAADRVREFALVLTFLKLRSATGAWTSPIALT